MYSVIAPSINCVSLWMGRGGMHFWCSDTSWDVRQLDCAMSAGPALTKVTARAGAIVMEGTLQELAWQMLPTDDPPALASFTGEAPQPPGAVLSTGRLQGCTSLRNTISWHLQHRVGQSTKALQDIL